MTGFSRNVRNLMLVRSKGACELCFFGRVQHLHHRRPRGMGSTRRPESNWPSNGMAICEPCHRMIESNREQALACGWLVRQGVDPMSVPILRHGCEWVVFDHDGGVQASLPYGWKDEGNTKNSGDRVIPSSSNPDGRQ